MRNTILIIIALILGSCSATNLLNRGKKLIARAEAKGATWSTDTVYKDVIVKVPELRVDTLVNFTYDTITVTKDNIVTKVKIDRQTKKIYISSTRKAKKVIVKTTYTIQKTISAGYSRLEAFGCVLLGLILGAFLGRLFWK